MIKWILVIICMLQIFLLSSDPADLSNKKSNHVIVWIAEVLAGHTLSEDVRQEKIEEYVLFVRKGAHIFVYFLLGFFILSLMKEYHVITWKIVLLAFFFSFLYACSDEVHQLFVPGRSGNIIDIGIDSIGSFLGVLCYYLFYRFRRKYE